jgi:3-deoxy-D-manno-octulosonic-acid transferase
MRTWVWRIPDLVSGNMKFDAGTTGEQDSLPAEFISHLAGKTTDLAGSTHDPEERNRRGFSASAQTTLRPALIIAPRHPERFAEVASLLNSCIPWSRRAGNA